jgi:hypothetical protein
MKCEETVIEGAKLASIANHLKSNRLEYLVLILMAHAVGITAKITEQTSGMCL